MSPTTRSGITPASRAYRAPPSAATTRSARPAMRRSRSGGSGAPFRKMAARTLECLRPPISDLAWGGLRPFERPEQHHHGDQGDGEAGHQVRRVVRCRVEVRVPPFGGVRGEEDDARDEVAEKAGQHRDDGAQNSVPNGGLEETGEPQNAEGYRVVEEDLHRVHYKRLDGQVQEAVDRPSEDADPRALTQSQQYEGHHLERDRASEGHLPDLDQAEHERQSHGEGRLREHPGVSERVHSAPSFFLRGCTERAPESPCAGITRIRFNGSAPRRRPLSLAAPRYSWSPKCILCLVRRQVP